MKIIKLSFLSLLISFFMAMPTHALMLGNQLLMEWYLGSSIFDTTTATVDDTGIEWVVTPDVSVDISDTRIVVQNATSGWANGGGFNGFVLTDINNTIDAFTSFSVYDITGNVAEFAPVLTFTENTLTVNLNPASVSNLAPGRGMTYIFEAGDAAPVPEPSTVLLLGTGLVTLVAVGRKRSSRK